MPLPTLRNSHDILDSWLTWTKDENGVYHVASVGELGMISKPLCGTVDHTLYGGLWEDPQDGEYEVCKECLRGLESGHIRQ